MAETVTPGASIRTSTTRSTNSDGASRASTSSRSIGGGYPSANQQHVDYILVAEFSIDKGSMMEYQYPNPISGDEQ